MVVSTVPSQQESFWCESQLGSLCVEFGCYPSACIRTQPSSHCPKTVWLTGHSKLSLGVSVSVDGCLSRLSLCGPVMDWRPVQGVPCLLPNDSWDRLQPPETLNWIERV